MATQPTELEGQQPKRRGRPMGRVADSTLIAKRFADRILNSPEYEQWTKDRIKEGVLPWQIEQMLWHYARGKPKEVVDLTVRPGAPSAADLRSLTNEELAARAAVARAQIMTLPEPAENEDENTLEAEVVSRG